MNTPILRSLALLLLVTAPVLKAQVPQIINYQGRVAVGTVNFNGSGSFKFALVNANGSVTYWSNDGTSTAGSEPTAAVTLTVTKGLYSVLLGDASLTNMTAIPNSVFANSDVRLRVWFNDGTNGSQLLTPDQRLAAVGYAMVAGTLQGGATISTDTALPAVSLRNTTDNLAALSLNTPFSTWWLGQNRPPDNTAAIDSFFLYDQSAGATRLLIRPSGDIGIGTTIPVSKLQVVGTVTATAFAGSGAGLTNLPVVAGVTLVDGNSVTLGRVLSSSRDGSTVLTSTGHQVFISYDGVFYPAQLYYTGSNGTGTAYLNDGGGGTITEVEKINGKWVVYSGSFASLMEPDTVVNGTEANTTFTALSIDNPTNSNFAAATRSGWKLKTITRAAAGLPATIALPITLQ